MIQIYNEDCILTMRDRLQEKSIDVILTSPPYNNSNRTGHKKSSLQKSFSRYDKYDDKKTNEEYCQWICNIFNEFDRILKENGTVLWNISYSGVNPSCMFKCISDICDNTPFIISDLISWKKNLSSPNAVSPNKLTRIVEYIAVFCRKEEYDTFYMNKKVVSKSKNRGQDYYENIPNYIEAENNDGVCFLNRATYSTELCEKLLSLYAKISDSTFVYDPFMGTGTTASACKNLKLNCIGSEISKEQCDFAEKRLVIGMEVYKDKESYFSENEYKKEELFV